MLALAESQELKQKEIDAMEIQSYQVDGLAQVRYYDVLFACVQRAYKNNNPDSAFRIDDQDQENMQDENKFMPGVPIETLRNMFALTIVQAKCVANEL